MKYVFYTKWTRFLKLIKKFLLLGNISLKINDFYNNISKDKMKVKKAKWKILEEHGFPRFTVFKNSLFLNDERRRELIKKKHNKIRTV